MPAHHFDPRPLTWNPPGRRGGSFRGSGKLIQHGARHNPAGWTSRRTIAGRMIVGFSVGEVPTWGMPDLVALVERVRTDQTGDPSSTFVAQHGIYQHKDKKRIVHEDGGQVFILAGEGMDEEGVDVRDLVFTKQMIELAEIVAREFAQESVIVEIQFNGISQITMGVEP